MTLGDSGDLPLCIRKFTTHLRSRPGQEFSLNFFSGLWEKLGGGMYLEILHVIMKLTFEGFREHPGIPFSCPSPYKTSLLRRGNPPREEMRLRSMISFLMLVHLIFHWLRTTKWRFLGQELPKGVSQFLSF